MNKPLYLQNTYGIVIGMAKKGKSTLKDLDQFLKQQPNQLVNVETASAGANTDEPATDVLTPELVAQVVERLAAQQGQSISQTVANVVAILLNDRQDTTASELMLQNTLLFLQHHEESIAALQAK